MFASLSWEKDSTLFLKGANLHTTKNTMVSQEGDDITLFLHSVCEFGYDFPGYWKDHRNDSNSLCLLSDNESSFQCVRKRKTSPRIPLISKGDGFLGRRSQVELWQSFWLSSSSWAFKAQVFKEKNKTTLKQIVQCTPKLLVKEKGK